MRPIWRPCSCFTNGVSHTADVDVHLLLTCRKNNDTTCLCVDVHLLLTCFESNNQRMQVLILAKVTLMLFGSLPWRCVHLAAVETRV